MEETKLKRPVRAAAVFFAVSALCRAAGFLFTPLFTRVLPPAEFGALSLYTLWLGIFTVLMTWELWGGGFLRGFQKAPGRDRFLCASMGLSLTVFGVSFLLAVLFLRPLSGATGLPALWLLLLFLQIGGTIPLSFLGAKSRFFSRPALFAAFELAVTVLPLAVSYTLIGFFSLPAETRIVCASGTNVLIGTVSALILLRGGQPLFDREIWASTVKRALPLLPHYLAIAAIADTGRLFLERFFGKSALAPFGIVFSLGTATLMIGNAVLSTFSPWLMRKLAQGETAVADRMLTSVSTVLSGLSLCAALLSPELLRLLAPQSYEASAALTYPLSLLPLPSFLIAVLITVLLYRGKPWLVSSVSVGTLVLTVGLHLFLVPRFGVWAAALLSPFSYLLLLSGYTAVSRKSAPDRSLNVNNSLQIYSVFVLFTLIFALWQPSFPIRAAGVFLLLLVCLFSALSVRNLLFERKGAVKKVQTEKGVS